MEELKWLKKLQLDIQGFCTVDIPEEFLCPITHEIMREPVTCSDGFTYEKNAIAEWFMSGKYTSPMTNAVLTNTTLVSNLELRDAIRKFLESAEETEEWKLRCPKYPYVPLVNQPQSGQIDAEVR